MAKILRTKGGNGIVSVEIVTQDHYAWAYTYETNGTPLFEAYSKGGGPRPRVEALGTAESLHGALHGFKVSAKRLSGVAVAGEILLHFSQKVGGETVPLRTLQVPITLKNNDLWMPHVFIDIQPPQ